MTSKREGGRLARIERADWSDTSCSPERPPKITPIRVFAVIQKSSFLPVASHCPNPRWALFLIPAVPQIFPERSGAPVGSTASNRWRRLIHHLRRNSREPH